MSNYNQILTNAAGVIKDVIHSTISAAELGTEFDAIKVATDSKQNATDVLGVAYGGTGATTAAAARTAIGAAASGANTFTGAQNEAQGADIASASTINLDAATGNLVDVTGSVTITAITLAQGAERVVRFTGAPTLTNGASLVLPGGANIVASAGSFATFRGYAGGVVRCVVFTPASGAHFPAGTKMVFAQAAAPAGWTQDASNDQVLRVVSGAGGGAGGSLSITSTVTGGHILSTAEMPVHNHGVTDPQHAHTYAVMANWGASNNMAGGNAATQPVNNAATSSSATGISINNSGGDGAHTHPLAIKYQDVIICSKN